MVTIRHFNSLPVTTLSPSVRLIDRFEKLHPET
jgi:hypothetical protein